MPVAIALIVVGFTLIYSALKGLSLTETFAGKTGDKLDPKGGGGDFANGGATIGGGTIGGSPSNVNPSGLTPEQIVNQVVIPLARRHGINVTVDSVKAANGRHGATITGGRSDHQGPGSERWAADLSNGSSPTPEMDALARALAREFGLKWNGSGAITGTWRGFRIQMIYRSLVGGNHFNHVHLGVATA